MLLRSTVKTSRQVLSIVKNNRDRAATDFFAHSLFKHAIVTKNSVDQIKMQQEQYDRVFRFVTESTKDFDDSHNEKHAKEVRDLSLEIANGEKDRLNICTFTIEALALLHDVRDHKYPNSITEDELIRFMIKEFGEERALHIRELIDNVSFSKESKGLCKTFPDQDNLAIVRDADRIQALGELGFMRCVKFIESNNPTYTSTEVMKSFVQHAYEKLLRLLPEGYIVTETGKKLAKEAHESMESIVARIELVTEESRIEP